MAVSLLTRWRWAALAVLLTTLLIIVPVGSGQNLTLNTAGYDFPHGYLNLMGNPIIWEFAAGVVTGLLWPHMRKLPVAARIPMLVAGTLLAVIQIVLNRHVGHGLTESGTVLALLLAAVAFNDDWLARITPGWLVFIGDISFSLYLLHMVTMRVVKKPVRGGCHAFYNSNDCVGVYRMAVSSLCRAFGAKAVHARGDLTLLISIRRNEQAYRNTEYLTNKSAWKMIVPAAFPQNFR